MSESGLNARAVLRTAPTWLTLRRNRTEITVGATPALDPPDRVTAYAEEVLRQHTPDRDGWCLGCLALWGRLVFIEKCTQVQWAVAVRAVYGEARRDNGQAAPTN